MTSAAPARFRMAAATRVIVRVVLYYGVVLGVSVWAWRHLPRTQVATLEELAALLGGAASATVPAAGERAPGGALADVGPAVAVSLAMLAAALLALPVAWVYLLTRTKRGYQQSVVHTLVILPMVVAGVVVLVRDSLALAFSLAGIVAAVRFRTPLDDSKDAVYVFLATGVGLAAAVNLPVAAAMSICFNVAIVLLWRSDFARAPVQLDGRLAEQRLERARALARTGTFVARMDEEVFRDMTAEQLDGVAERARRRARQHDAELAAAGGNGADDPEAQLLVRTRDVAAARRAVEAQLLPDRVKRWRYGGAVVGSDGTQVLEYVVVMKKAKQPEELAALLRESAGGDVLAAEVG
jgi:hypothetical protein